MNFIPDYSLGREMMAMRVASQFCGLGEVHDFPMNAEQAANRPPALVQALSRQT